MTTQAYCEVLICLNYSLKGIPFCREHIQNLGDCEEIVIGLYWGGHSTINPNLACSFCNKFFINNHNMYENQYANKFYCRSVVMLYQKYNIIICKPCYEYYRNTTNCKKYEKLFLLRSKFFQYFRSNR